MGFFAELIESMRRPGAPSDRASTARTLIIDKPQRHDFLRPQGHALALEPRIMFDGAAAAATADQQNHADAGRTPEAPAAERSPTASATRTDAAIATATPNAAPNAAPPAHSLLVVDSRVEQRELISAHAAPGVSVLVVDTQQDGLAAISAALASLGQVDSIQILSHGAAGQFTLGNRTITSDNVDQLGGQLQAWRAELAPGADIQLYGCNVGAGAAGQTLVNELARWTGADVGASADATGNAADGGNWALETRAGDVDKAIALGADTLAAFEGLLPDATPTVTLSSNGDDVLLGSEFTITASFTNPSTQVGFAPFIDLFIPVTGKDGAGTEIDDGISFVSATFEGQQIQTYTVTFDANGQAIHPLAKDATGQAIILNAADYGMRAGDQLVVLQLPNASIVSGQPSVNIAITLRLSELADTTLSDAAPGLTVRARAGFQFGNTSADDPTVDPTLITLGTQDFVVHPTMVDLTQTVNVPDGQTVTGPNYPRSIVVTASVAPGQTLNNVVVEQDLPDDIMVTGIVTGAGGAVTSITLQDGTVITDAGTIASTLAAGAYLSHYEVTYATLSGSVDTTVQFYVPEVDADGNPVLDPNTGAPRTVTIAAPEASAGWTPEDPRDVPLPGQVITGTGEDVSFTIQSIVVYKEAAVTTDVGSAGASPGDTITYTLEVDISDYFAFGENALNQGSLIIMDEASDGQSVVPGSGTFTVTIDGQTLTMVITPTVVVNPDGSTSLALDLAQTLRDNGRALAALVGDLAFDDVLAGATTAVISYQTTIAQNYDAGTSHDAINEGDSIGNNATITGTVLPDRFNTGGTASDTDGTTVDIPANKVDIIVWMVNGQPAPANVELRPGDVVTFQISYDLLTGDYQSFMLSAYLPLPLFDVNGINWTQGTGINQWTTGPGHTITDTVEGVSGVVNGNYIVFDFGDHTSPLTQGSRVEVQFTMVVGDTPFGDQRKVTVIAQSDQLTTLDGEHLISEDAAVISSIAEPVLAISHGVVSATHGTVTGAGANNWALPGDTTNPPFTVPLTEIADVNGNVSGIDGADLLRMATAIENSGGGGAYDVSTRVDLPAGLSFAGGSLAQTLRIYRGDGTLLVAGTDYTVTGNTVTFLDPTPGAASLLAGRPGTAADTSGQNLVVLLYDVQVASDIAASSTLQSTAVLTNYAAVNDGEDFTPVDLSDLAGQQVAAPGIVKQFANGSLSDDDSSATHTTGANLVVGETMTYDIVVTLPEGTATNLRIDDLIPPGLALDMSFNGGVGYQIIQTVAGSGALTADFAGTLTGGTPQGLGGTVGQDGVDARLSFTASVNAADNNEGNNSFVIRVRLVASNTLDNQAGRSLSNSAQITFTDPDGDQAGGTAADRTVALSGGLPSVTLQEPTLTVTQSQTNNGSTLGVDEGNLINYTITIGNSSGINAFDISFAENFPTQFLTGFTNLNVTYANGAVIEGGGLGFEIVNGVLRTINGANIDIAAGGTITITLTATVTDQAVNVQTIDSTASVQWTSLDGAAPVVSAGGERTGADGLLNSGVLNDYRSQALTSVKVLSGVQLSRVGGLPDTPIADGGTDTDGANEQVAVGEIVRYRVVSAVGQGTTTGYQVQVTLDEGLNFLADGTIKIALVSNGGVTSTVVLNSDGSLMVIGDRSSAIALPISPTLAGQAPTATMNPSLVSVSADGRTITFNLGDITNSDNDANLEGVVIEFNARVANIAGNTAGQALDVTASVLAAGAVGATDSATETVVEPQFSGLVKQVQSFTPNASGTTSTANMSVSFTQSGSATAYDVHLDDSLAGVGAYTLTSVTIIDANGTARTVLPADFAAEGITDTTDATGVHLSVDRVAVGTRVVVNYSVTVDVDTAYANTDAVLTWSSLPESFTTWGGTAVGVDATADGERDGSNAGPNTYILREGAGLGLVHGTLWDDSLSADASLTPDGTRLANTTVTLRFAGADGALDSGDDQLFTTATDANGYFHFSALAAGNYRVEAPGTVTLASPIGDLRVRIDSDGNILGQVGLAPLGEGATADASFGYVQLNDAPVNTVPTDVQSGDEDVLLALDPLSVADVDLDNSGTPGVLDVTLQVTRGVIGFSGTLPAGLTVGGTGTGTVTLSGSAADLNAALAMLTYQGVANFNGTDTLTITTRDRGSFGDADGDGIPGENAEDQLQDIDTVTIVLDPVNDIPVAVNDAVTAVEAGGTDNGTPGVDPSGNILANDIDVDMDTSTNPSGDELHLVTVTSNLTSNTASPTGTDEFAIVGQYGTLYVRANGAARYVVDNDNADVQALRIAGQTLQESFSYTVADRANAQATNPGVLTVTIQGANDTPVATDDVGTAVEAGGVNNGTGGSPASGNVILGDANGGVADTDVDSVANGEARTVTGIRNMPETEAGDLTPVVAGTGTSIAGRYGTLTIDADGSYTYVVDNNNATVQALSTGQTLQDVFSYEVTDAGGLSDLANLSITINGSFDNPVASDDLAQAQAQGFDSGNNPIGQESNPSGNVITDPSRPDGVPTPGTGIDTDVDAIDQPNTELTVVAARTGQESAGTAPGAFTGSVVLVGTYGTLTLNSDGSYTYDVDSTNTAVRARQAGDDPLEDYFTYQIQDQGGLTDIAQLRINVFGVNDPPVAQNVNAIAVEAGGINNETAGIDPSGDAIQASVDPDGDPLNAIAIRTGAETDTGGTSGTIGQPLQGLYGTLTLNADGTFSYVLNNADPLVQALRTIGNTLSERFTYTLSDGEGGTDQAEIIIRILGRNDNPVAVDDAGSMSEAGGINNNIPGVNATGNVLGNDTDVDSVANGETKTVSAVGAGSEAAPGAAGTVGTELRGTYGWLTLNADGSYVYRLDDAMPAVQALRLAGNTLQDQFHYTVSDTAQAGDIATLTITITGANDNPVAQNDVGTAVEAGGVNNGTPGSNATGNVLANDSDVDLNGETKAVQGVAQGGSSAAAGAAFAVQWGTLTLNANGSYTYVVNNANPTVQALQQGETLTEVVTYTMVDALGATSTATLTITIQGADDAPTAQNDAATAVEAGGVNNATPGQNGTGNVIGNDGDVDDPGTALAVTAVRTGQEAASGAAGTVGTALVGQYGSLTLNANGSYTYVVDNSNAAVQALRLSGNTLLDYFTYTVSDPRGLVDTAQIAITIQGANDNPVAANDAGTAIEAGGVNNGTPGSNATGNVLANDTDVDLNGETKNVSAFDRVGGGAGTVGAQFTAQYGWLTLNADGSYTYVVDNANTTVQALLPGQTLAETFNYTVIDALGATSAAQLTITIQGRDDTPVAIDDAALAVESGGTANATPGINPSGNVLSNDTDVDNTDPRRMDGIRTGTEAEGGAFVTVGALQPGTIAGRFGTLTVRADGSYSYVVNNNAVLVERMRGGNQDSLVDTFSYRTVDLAGQSDIAQLVITVDGAWDAPVGVDDANFAAAGTIRNPGQGVDAVGNVLPNDTDVDVPDGKTVTGIGVGAEAGNPALSPVAASFDIDGLYGTLTINADGSYTYRVDVLNLTVQGLQPGQTLDEIFTYELTDNGGLTDRAQLVIEVRGINNPPFTVPDLGPAVEAGGLDNGTPGENPRGNVLANDIDLDGDALTITGIRTGPVTGTGSDGAVGQVLRGQYGSLVMLANGDWTYVVDNDLPEVQALRISGQTLRESFTYTVTDVLGDTDTGELLIVIDGRNDTPVAQDDAGEALEAGGVNNGTPGSDSTGNVLDNDNDVDGVANGETEQVVSYASTNGAVGEAGSTISGLYGSLVINADGSWRYVVDNQNAAVQALRTSGETLTESFSYVMRDTEGATSAAHLVIVVRGADDNPVARDDSNVASDQVVAPQAGGNVLPNDSDVDGGDALQVAAIRTGAEAGTGTAGQLGQPLAGRYGTLIIFADGSYTYSIDLSNPEVLAAAGFGQILQDVFTYTLSDRLGATDLAQLTISLDISAPRIDGDPDMKPLFAGDLPQRTFDLGFTPGIFVQPVVRQSAAVDVMSEASANGTRVGWVMDRGMFAPASLGNGLGNVAGQFVGEVVRESQAAAQFELAQLLGRQGRVSLSADGLLADPSLFSLTSDGLAAGEAQRPGLEGAAEPRQAPQPQLGRDVPPAPTAAPQATTAPAFTEQLKLAARRNSAVPH